MISEKRAEAVEFYIGDLDRAVRGIRQALEEEDEEELLEKIHDAKRALEEMEA